ncbi:MAG: DUF3329 domain-containing protein [Hyphomicrobiaceae bacterium]|nr:DUF3329 domain-containing protein [Hyphomicrobiaceae bacterium]
MFDLNHPFFKPLLVRILVTVLVLGWGLFELTMGSVFWAILFLAMGAYCVYGFFFNFNPRDDQ